MCVSRSLTFCLKTKMSWRQTPSRKKKAAVFTNVTANAYQGRLNAGFSKVCEILSHTSLLLWRHFHALKRDAERNQLWLVVWHVSQTASWVGLDQWMQPYIQPSVWRSGYARLHMAWPPNALNSPSNCNSSWTAEKPGHRDHPSLHTKSSRWNPSIFVL